MAKAQVPMKTCPRCKKSMSEVQFYSYKNGRKTDLCKKCLTAHVDNFDESTYLWILKDLDIPYVPNEWNIIREKAFYADPDKMDGMTVLGKYLSKMKLRQWSSYTWADTEKLKEEAEARLAAIPAPDPAVTAEFRRQLEAGEISEAQYKTLANVEDQYQEYINNPPKVDILGKNNMFDESQFLAEEELPDYTSELTLDDKKFLAIKWGRLYRASEWVELERMYNEMNASFEIQDADTANTLILLCKTNLKMNQALDSGDIEGFQKLSKVSEALRKSAKFMASQRKEDKDGVIDSVGQLVELCEREGFIPRYATDVPQDKVDATLKDMNDYLRKLVTQDLGFGQQIEDAIRKIQIQKEMNETDEEIFNSSSSDLDYETTEQDMIQYLENQQQEEGED